MNEVNPKPYLSAFKFYDSMNLHWGSFLQCCIRYPKTLFQLLRPLHVLVTLSCSSLSIFFAISGDEGQREFEGTTSTEVENRKGPLFLFNLCILNSLSNSRHPMCHGAYRNPKPFYFPMFRRGRIALRNPSFNHREISSFRSEGQLGFDMVKTTQYSRSQKVGTSFSSCP